MAVNSVDIKLLNGSKQEVSYTGVETITIPKAVGSGVETFTAGIPLDSSAVQITPDFTSGNMVVDAPSGYVVRDAVLLKPSGMESVIAKGGSLMGVAGEYVTPGTTKSVSLDFSSGDMSIAASGDARWSQIDIFKPATLISENIPKGIEIAGVPGALEAITVDAVIDRDFPDPLESDQATNLPAAIFMYAKITEASFPACTVIGSYAFSDCTALKTVTLGCDSNFYHHLYDSAFWRCSNLSELRFMYSGSYVDGAIVLNSYSNQASGIFAYCSQLKSIHVALKSSMTAGHGAVFGSYLFQNCIALSEITVDGLVGAYRTGASSAQGTYEIDQYAFAGCENLSTLSLSLIGTAGFYVSDHAFLGCSKLQDLWLNFTSIPTNKPVSRCFRLGSSAFSGTPMASSGLTGSFGKIHVTKNAYSYLRVAYGWSSFSARMVSY